MGAWQGAELERVGGAVPGLIRLWKTIEKSKHPRMKPIRGGTRPDIVSLYGIRERSVCPRIPNDLFGRKPPGGSTVPCFV